MTRNKLVWIRRISSNWIRNSRSSKFLSDIVSNLEISKYSKYESFIDNIEDQTLRTILKYKNHPSIIAIQNKFKGGNLFYFRELNKNKNKTKK